MIDALAPGGWLAFQVPGNFAEPSHRLLHQLADDRRFAASPPTVERPAAYDAGDYLADLAGLGCRVDAWETTYLHVLTGPDPVFRWISGTGARPVLQALPEALREEFVAEYKGCWPRPTRPGRTAPCCRSAGSSWSPSGQRPAERCHTADVIIVRATTSCPATRAGWTASWSR